MSLLSEYKKLIEMERSVLKPAPPRAVAPAIPERLDPKLKDEDAMREWLTLAKSIGATPQQIGEVELKLWLKEECIQVFNTQKVFDYLKDKAKDYKWSFQGLRACDTKRDLHAYATWPAGCGHTLAQTLYAVVPIPVLMTVQRIVERFGDRANFFVTKIGDPDPFRAVTVDDCAIVFIERWDEPSYRG